MLLQFAAQARAYGAQVRQTLENEGVPAALVALNDILCERTPFRLLDLVGAALDTADANAVDELLRAIGKQRSEGGWVVIASALGLPIAITLVIWQGAKYSDYRDLPKA